jgi:hypothetical protein
MDMNHPSTCAAGAVFMLLLSAFPRGAQEPFPAQVACETAPAVLRNSSLSLEAGAVEPRGVKGCVQEPEGSAKCGWMVELTRAEWWGTDPPLLLVVIRSNHEPGSGVYGHSAHDGHKVGVEYQRRPR